MDSAGAVAVMKAVKRLVSGNRSVICTIHQPSQEVFNLFDRLLLLGKGGNTVYFGDVSNVGDYFMKQHIFSNIPQHRNIADIILDASGAAFSTTSTTPTTTTTTTTTKEQDNHNNNNEALSKNSVEQDEKHKESAIVPSEAYANSSLQAENALALKQGISKVDDKLPQYMNKYAVPSILRQMILLIRRFLIDYWREPMELAVRLIMPIFMPVCIML